MDFTVLEEGKRSSPYFDGRYANDFSIIEDCSWETAYLMGVISQLVDRIEELEKRTLVNLF